MINLRKIIDNIEKVYSKWVEREQSYDESRSLGYTVRVVPFGY